MPSKATTVAQYLEELPPDRRAALSTVRDLILSAVDGDIEEGITYGMIGYYVPRRAFPQVHHCNPSQLKRYRTASPRPARNWIWAAKKAGARPNETP